MLPGRFVTICTEFTFAVADLPHRPQAGRDHQDAQDRPPEAGRTGSAAETGDSGDVEDGHRGRHRGDRVQVVNFSSDATVQCVIVIKNVKDAQKNGV